MVVAAQAVTATAVVAAVMVVVMEGVAGSGAGMARALNAAVTLSSSSSSSSSKESITELVPAPAVEVAETMTVAASRRYRGTRTDSTMGVPRQQCRGRRSVRRAVVVEAAVVVVGLAVTMAPVMVGAIRSLLYAGAETRCPPSFPRTSRRPPPRWVTAYLFFFFVNLRFFTNRFNEKPRATTARFFCLAYKALILPLALPMFVF